MSKLLIIDSFALVKAWATGFFVLHISGIIHLLLVIALFALSLGLLKKLK